MTDRSREASDGRPATVDRAVTESGRHDDEIPSSDGGSRTDSSGDDRSRRWTWAWWVALVSPVVVPWVVVRTTSATLVYPWGMVTVESRHVVSLPAYLSATSGYGLPRHLELWPLGALCYALALAWAVGERVGGDQRVTAGFLVLAAITAAWMASGLAVGPNRTAIPLGSVLLVGLAVWAVYRSRPPR